MSGALKKALESDAGHFRWVAAVSGSQTAASLELGTGGEPVMAIGGFNNQGGNLSLAQFKAYVAKGEIHYYIASGSGGAGGRGGGRWHPGAAGRGGSLQQQCDRQLGEGELQGREDREPDRLRPHAGGS